MPYRFFASGFADDIDDLKAALDDILRPEIGLPLTHITGPVQFNEAGDLTTGNYVFYQVIEDNGAFRWTKYATFYRGYDLDGIVYN